MHTRKLIVALSATAAMLLWQVPVHAQLVLAEGLIEKRWAELPLFGTGDFDLEPSGGVVLYDQGDVVRIDQHGQRTVLWRTPANGSLAFVRTAPDGNSVLLGDALSGDIRRLPLPTGTPTTIANVRNVFDLDFDPFGRAFVSANPEFGLPGARNKVLHLELASGKLHEVASFAGPSGPLQFASDGAMCYATQSSIHPTPPGAVQVLRFTRAQVDAALAGQKLSERDGQVWAANLDGAYRLAFDDRDQLLVSDPLNGGVLRISADGQRSAALVPRDGRVFVTALRHRKLGQGVLAPFQPPGAALLLLATDWQGWTRLLEVAPRRPALFHVPANPVPDGPFQVFLDHGPQHGLGLLLLARDLLVDEASLPLPDGVPLWFGLDPTGLIAHIAAGLDQGGGLQLPLANPPGINGRLGAQLLVFDRNAKLLGSSQPSAIELR